MTTIVTDTSYARLPDIKVGACDVADDVAMALADIYNADVIKKGDTVELVLYNGQRFLLSVAAEDCA